MISAYKSTPIGSLHRISDEERLPYIETILETPENVQRIIFSANTGAFFRGICKQFQLAPEIAEEIAFLFTLICIGKIEFHQFAVQLSSRLRISLNQANQISQEIEKEIIAPVSLELNQYLSKRKQQKNTLVKTQSTTTLGAPSNLLNLKDNRKPPRPPSIPPISNP